MKKGFTLIELLVVVLIIGILSAVALPKYQYAVNKARFQQLVVLGEGIFKAEEIYYMANGVYTPDFESLDISLPPGFTLSSGSARNNTMTCSVIHNFNPRVYCVFNNARKALTNVAYIHWFDNRRACVLFASTQEGNDFCSRFSGHSDYETYGAWRIYYINN